MTAIPANLDLEGGWFYGAGGSPAAGVFLLRGQEKDTKEKAAPMRWFSAMPRTSLPPAKKRGASQLDLVWKMGSDSMFRARVRLMLTKNEPKIESDPIFPRDSDKGSPQAPRFLACGRQHIGETTLTQVQ